MDTSAILSNFEQKTSHKPPIENPVIKIIDIVDGELVLDDDDETVTFPNNEITWEIHTTKVTEIFLILPDNVPSKVFRERPNNRRPSKTWKGKTKYKRNLPDQFTREKYTIIYKRSDTGDKLHFQDPIIQVNN